jgi:hypothetical protein
MLEWKNNRILVAGSKNPTIRNGVGISPNNKVISI